MSKIEDVCLVGDGAHASIKRCETGVLYLTAKNFNAMGLDLSKTEFISEDDYKKHFCKKTDTVINVKKDDLVFSIIGSIGSPYVVKEGDVFGLSSSVAILRPDKNKLSSKFLYYWILSDFFQKYVENIKSGVAQGFLSLGMIKKLPVLLPPPPTQQKIADILSAYDELIENNNRRIELLEKAAQNLYKEWFVRFRFPGHKQTKFESGLPQGWVVKKLSEFVYVTDGTHDTPKQTESGYYLVTGKCITNDFIDFNKAYFISKDEHEKIKKRSGLNKGDILFSNIGTVGSVSIIDYDIDFSVKNVIILKTQIDVEKCYLYCLFKNSTIQDLFKQQTNGSSQQFISLGFMRNFKILISKDEILEQFAKVVQPIIAEKYNLYKQNRNLIKQRDLLLPRLMSGKLEV